MPKNQAMLRQVRSTTLLVILLLAAPLAAAPAARATDPSCISASAYAAPAPAQVALTDTCSPAADEPVDVRRRNRSRNGHLGPNTNSLLAAYTVKLAAHASGESTSTYSAGIDSVSITLQQPSPATFGQTVTVTGTLVPAVANIAVDLGSGGIAIASAKTQVDGGGRLQFPAREPRSIYRHRPLLQRVGSRERRRLDQRRLCPDSAAPPRQFGR